MVDRGFKDEIVSAQWCVFKEPAMATVIVIAGPDQGGVCHVEHPKVLIGRHETCQLQLHDDRVSNKHLEIRYEPADKTYRIRDLQSTNGSLLKSDRLTFERTLSEHDEITLGSTRLLFCLADYADAAAAQAAVNTLGARDKS